MTRYFFDIQDGSDITQDDTGLELASLHEARVEAVLALAEFAKEVLPTDGCEHAFLITIRENDKPVLLTKLLFEAVPIGE